MKLESGEGRVQRALIQTQAFDSADFDENRVAGMIWGMAQRPGAFGLALSSGVAAEITPDSVIRIVPRPIMPKSPLPESPARGQEGAKNGDESGTQPAAPYAPLGSSVLLFEGAGLKAIRFGESLISKESTSPRQVAGFEGGVLHVLRPGWQYDSAKRLIEPPVDDLPAQKRP
jgi:hypothetical protein